MFYEDVCVWQLINGINYTVFYKYKMNIVYFISKRQLVRNKSQILLFSLKMHSSIISCFIDDFFH